MSNRGKGSSRPWRRGAFRNHRVAAVALSLLLGACGDDAGTKSGDAAQQPGQPAAGAPEGWSPPASGDGEPVLTAEEAMATVEKMLKDPKTLRSEAFGLAVRRLTQILWPIATGETPPPGARAHEQLAQITRSMAIEIDKDPLHTQSLEADGKIEYDIHNRYRIMLGDPPKAFREFFETRGVEALRELAEARQKRFFGPK